MRKLAGRQPIGGNVKMFTERQTGALALLMTVVLLLLLLPPVH